MVVHIKLNAFSLQIRIQRIFNYCLHGSKFLNLRSILPYVCCPLHCLEVRCSNTYGGPSYIKMCLTLFYFPTQALRYRKIIGIGKTFLDFSEKNNYCFELKKAVLLNVCLLFVFLSVCIKRWSEDDSINFHQIVNYYHIQVVIHSDFRFQW